MRNQSVRSVAEANGFYTKTVSVNGRPQHRWSCECSRCGEETVFNWAGNTSPEMMVKNLLKGGWTTRHKEHVCPKCVGEAKEKRKVSNMEIVPNPKLQRKVFALLDDHFDEERRLYRSGWSDKKVAEAADTSEQFVVSLRKGAYGELAEDPALTALRAEIDGLTTEAKTLADDLMERMSKIEEKVTTLRARIDSYAMKKAS